MLLMLWVNDFAGMDGIPQWMLHAPTRVDMLGLSDLAFPSFLFCMGLSIPFAIENRLTKGDGALKTLGHIFLRSLSLILLGLMELNETGSLYELVLGIAIFLVWNNYPKGFRKWLRIALTVIGLGAIAWLAHTAWPMRISWWGILGLIGWSYLMCALLYLALRRVRFAVPVVWLIVLALAILDNVRGLHIAPAYPGGWVDVGLAFTGLTFSYVAKQLGDKKKLVPGIMLCGAVLMAVGYIISHNHWIISKNLGTPTWMFLCMAIDLVLLAVLFYVSDIKGRSGWASPIRAAGTSTFTCYCLPFIAYPLMDYLHLWLQGSFRSGICGLLLAMLFALVMILLAELLSRIHIKLKL